jgi:preprotein translocase subunit SecY
VFALSLAVAAWQGYGVLTVLAGAEILRPETGVVLAALACFIGCTALTIWLADDFGFLGLGGGFWPLMAILFLASLPGQASTLIQMLRIEAASGGQLLIAGLSLVAGLALVVVANQLLSQNGRTTGLT